MTADPGSEQLPPLYAKWVDELLGGKIPRESRATCGSCAMRAEPATSINRAEPATSLGRAEPATASVTPSIAQDRGTFFDPVIKCCTYLPTLYNFLAGRILSDQDPAAAEGRETVLARLARGIGVSPLGLMSTPTYALLYGNSKQSFGKSRALKCPHYIEDGGRCGVWAHRESTCATWFCKHVKGGAGYAFWRDGLHRLLEIVEISLARWCLLEMKVRPALLKAAMGSKAWKAEAEDVTGAVLDNTPDPAVHAQAWAEWRGREEAFFIACAERVDALSWTDVMNICGPDARAQAQLTQEAYRRLVSNEVPAAVRTGPFQVVQIGRETVRLNTYSEYDPIDVPGVVLDLLAQFDGRPTKDVLAAIAAEHGIALEPALVQKMTDFELLVPADKL